MTRSGHWLILAAAVLWGTTGTAQAFVPEGARPVEVGAVRLAIGGAALLSFSMVRGEFRDRRQLPLVPTALAAAGVAFYQLCFFAAVATTGVAVGTLVVIGSSPILAGILSYLLRGEKPERKWFVATALAVLGSFLMLSGDGLSTLNSGGFLLALGAGLSYAVFSLASKALLDDWPPDAAMALVFGLGGLALIPVILSSDLIWLSGIRGWLVALHLGLLATFLAYILFARGLKNTPVSTAVSLSLLEPLTAAILGVVMLREPVTLLSILGMMIVIAGIAWLSLGRNSIRIAMAD